VRTVNHAVASFLSKRQNQQLSAREHAHKSLELGGEMFAIVRFYQHRKFESKGEQK
jgi:hypothetical protein